MQFPNENHLVQQITKFLEGKRGDNNTPSILNIGAGKSLSIEKQLFALGCGYVCDRIDVNDCNVEFPSVRHCWICSVEAMAPVQSSKYLVSFANFVLEHVPNIPATAREINRVLSPSGIFVAALPNPTAPEFQLARRTPLWLHRLIRREEAWETCYSYRSIQELVKTFELNGFTAEDVTHWAYVEGYLWRYPVVNKLGRLYDGILQASGIKALMGQVCITFKKSL